MNSGMTIRTLDTDVDEADDCLDLDDYDDGTNFLLMMTMYVD